MGLWELRAVGRDFLNFWRQTRRSRRNRCARVDGGVVVGDCDILAGVRVGGGVCAGTSHCCGWVFVELGMLARGGGARGTCLLLLLTSLRERELGLEGLQDIRR